MKILQLVGVLSFRRLNPSVSALLLICMLAALPLPGLAARKIIFDTDPGSDDALALMLALNSPELDVRAITVVPGNVTAATGLENALRMVSLANRCDIPVAAGAQHPLFQKLITAEFWHGRNGLANVELPASKCKVDSRFGPDLIIQLVHAAPHEIILVPVGPLTNIAQAISIDPAVPDLAQELVVMGGSIAPLAPESEPAEHRRSRSTSHVVRPQPRQTYRHRMR